MKAADPYCRDAAITSLVNLMRWSEMLVGNFKPITGVSVIKSKEYYRYLSYPLANETGIIDFQKNPGDFFKKGDLLAIIRSIDGSLISKIKSELEGFVIGWWNNIAAYKGNTLGMVGVPDRLPMVVSWKEIESKESNPK